MYDICIGMSYRLQESHPLHESSRNVENVLVLQGGGSLGAFACGVFKALVKKDIRLDIVAGTSIGAINAAIIAGSKSDHPEKDLEDFWIELAQSTYRIIPDTFILDTRPESNYNALEAVRLKIISSASVNAAIFGGPKMFLPRWNLRYIINHKDFTFPSNWTYLYDHSPLGKTLERYIDFNKLSPKEWQQDLKQSSQFNTIRLITTAVNVLTAEPLVFDSTKMAVQIKHLLACSGYPIYGFPWK
jgi:NTE family protein